MANISIHIPLSMGSTSISNVFIDYFMPTANGSYVKVYLYLLRILSTEQKDLSISLLADKLENTESDILRALHYWEKKGLLSIQKNINGNITDLTFIEPETLITSRNSNSNVSNCFSTGAVQNNHLTTATPITLETATTKKQNIPVATSNREPSYQRKNYTVQEISTLSKNEEFQKLTLIIESYLERPLKPTDVQMIAFLRDTIGFSTELIMYLYEYCISNGKRRDNYIETVAINWANEGIRTVEQAEQTTAKYNADYNAVSKAFGLNRNPGTYEQKFIYRWSKEYKFDTVILAEACNRTIKNINKPDFSYADSILKNWYHQGVHTLADIEKIDNEHKETKKNRTHTPATNNSFNAFPQRSYTKEDFSSIEKRLLEKSYHNK
ncbi:MAG: DnaD domain protein [Lachnospiraceae bacterium]|nr:DnaD domain protein [Lachnospiraceae bacterium]